LPSWTIGQPTEESTFHVFKYLLKNFAEKQSSKELHQLLVDVNTALAVLERDVPVTIQVRLSSVIKAMF